MRWLHVTAALLLVLTTSMPSWAHMSCLMSGHDRWSIGELKDCCENDHPGEEAEFLDICCEGEQEHPADGVTLKAMCCEIAQITADRNDFLPQSTIQIHVPVTDVLTVDQALVTLNLAGWSIEHSTTRPPPLSGWSRAISNRTLLL